jgi:hypothetical protein
LQFLDSIEQRKAASREFCDKIILMLPRELRDMVYAYLVPDTSVDVYRLVDEDRLSEVTADNKRPPYGPCKFYLHHNPRKGVTVAKEYTLPYQPDEEAFGEALAKELCQYFHHHTHFYFDISNGHGTIAACMESDVLTYPIRKISVHVRLHLNMLDQSRGEEATRTRMLNNCMRPLKELTEFTVKNVDLRLHIWTYHQTIDQSEGFRTIFNVMLPHLVLIRDAGYSITIVADGKSHAYSITRSVKRNPEVVVKLQATDFSDERVMQLLREVSSQEHR